MGWSKVKKAINSTLGTDEFAPLDKLILGSKGLKASENFYSRVLSKSLTGRKDEPFVIENLMTMKWQGSLRLKISLRGETDDSYVGVKKNGVVVGALYASSLYSYSERHINISFTKGDVIGLELSSISNGNTVFIQYVDVYADVIDMSAFTVSEV